MFILNWFPMCFPEVVIWLKHREFCHFEGSPGWLAGDYENYVKNINKSETGIGASMISEDMRLD